MTLARDSRFSRTTGRRTADRTEARAAKPGGKTISIVAETASALDGIRPAFHEVKKRQRKELLTEYLAELNHELRRLRQRRKELILERRRVAVRVWVNAQVFPNDPDRWQSSSHPISTLEDDLQQLIRREGDVNSLIAKLRALISTKARLDRKEPAR